MKYLHTNLFFYILTDFVFIFLAFSQNILYFCMKNEQIFFSHIISTRKGMKSTLKEFYPQIVVNLWITRWKHVENYFQNTSESRKSNVDYVYNYSHFYPQSCGLALKKGVKFVFSTVCRLSYPQYQQFFGDYVNNFKFLFTFIWFFPLYALILMCMSFY